MQRKWAVRPDLGDQMSREALISALVDAATVLDIAGGVLEVVVGRVPTDVPGEMVMTGAVLCWKDRTDAKPQPEVAVQLVPTPTLRDVAVAEVTRPSHPSDETQFDPEAETAARLAADDVPLPPHIDPDDGFDYSKLAEEDVENQPVGSR